MGGPSKAGAVIKNAFVSWPPLILFTACLGLFSLVALALGAIVYGDEDITNNNLLTWNKFMSGLQHYEFCASLVPWHGPPYNGSETEAGYVTASVLMPVQPSVSLPENVSALVLDDSAVSPGLNVSIESVNVTGLLCVRVRGLAGSLPAADLPSPPACDTRPWPTPGQGGTLDLQPLPSGLVHRRQHCGQRPAYQLRYIGNHGWDVAIEEGDRAIMYAHLTCTSAFLVVTALCMLLCTLVRNRSRYTLVTGDKVSVADG